MPQIVLKGLREESVANISAELTRELARISDTPEDWFTVEYQPHVFYCQGVRVDHDPMVQVWWFDRGKAVQNAAAELLHRLLTEQGYRESEISFHLLEPGRYYENGTCLG